MRARRESGSPRKDPSWPPRAPPASPPTAPPRTAPAAPPPGASRSRRSASRSRSRTSSPSRPTASTGCSATRSGEARVEQAQKDGRDDVPTTSGLEEIFEEISPIEDFQGTMSLSFRDHRFEPPKYSIEDCKERDITYSAPLFVTAEFMNNTTGEIKSQTVFMGDFPLMTDKGTFVINGTERVVVSQLVRSPGVYFDKSVDKTSDKDVFGVQDHPVPRRLARVRDRQARPGRRPRRPQAQAVGHGAAQGPRLGRRQDPRGVRRLRVDPRHPGEGPHHRPGRRAARHLPQAAAGRAADPRGGADAAGQPLLQPEALRPGQGRPLQGQQEARARPAAALQRADRRRHRRDHPVPREAARRRDRDAGRSATPAAPSASRSTTSTTSATGACARWAS